MMRGFLFTSGTQVNSLRHRTPECSGSRCFEGVECLLSSILGRNTCLLSWRSVPLHVFSLEAVSLERTSCWDIHRLAFLRTFQKSDSSYPCFSQKHLARHSFVLFPSLLRLSLSTHVSSSCFIYSFIYLFFFHSFTESNTTLNDMNNKSKDEIDSEINEWMEIITKPTEESIPKNLFRMTAQYFLGTLHI